MSTITFLRLYVLSALLGSAGLWTVAASSEREARRLERSAVSFNHSRGLGEARLASAQGAERCGDLASARCPDREEALVRTARANADRWEASLPKGVTPRRDAGFEHLSRVSIRGSGLSRPGIFALMGRERGASVQGVGPVPGRFGRDARGHLRSLATAAANLCGVPVGIFHALIQRESSWRPWVVSSSGAVGLGQIKPSTLRDIDPRLNAWEPWDNLLGSACYLRQQFDRFGTWRKALHAYHAGPNRKATAQATHDYSDDIMGSAQ